MRRFLLTIVAVTTPLWRCAFKRRNLRMQYLSNKLCVRSGR